jgi:hypothetical protein
MPETLDQQLAAIDFKKIPKRKLLSYIDYAIREHRQYASNATGQSLINVIFNIACLLAIREIVEAIER